jgi:hypothetical protein
VRRHEEPPVGARHEQQEVPACDQLQEHHRLQLGAVEQAEILLMRRMGQHLHSDQQEPERLCHRKQAKRRRHAQEMRHVPPYRALRHRRVVVRDGHDRDIVQQRHDHDHDCGERLKGEKDRRKNHEKHDVHGQCHTIDRVARDATENAPCFVDGVVDHRKSRRGQDQGGGAARRVGRAGNRRPAIRLLQGRRVVHAVAGHRDDMAALLQGLHDRIFVLGKDPREAIGGLDRVRNPRRHIVRVHLRRKNLGGRQNVGAEPKLTGGLARDRGIVSGHHLDAHALALGLFDRRSGIIARRIEHRQDAEERPCRAGVARASDGEGAIAFFGKIGDGFFNPGGHVGRRLREGDDRLRGAFGDCEGRSTGVGNGRLRAFRYRIEWDEIGLTVGLQRVGVFERRDDRAVDCIAVVGFGGERAGEHDVLRILGRDQDRLAHGELVLGERAGLVGAQDVDAGHFLDSGEPRYDRLLLGQRERAQRHGDREHRGHRDRNRGNQQDQHELQDVQCIGQSPMVGDDDLPIDAHRHHDQGKRHGDRDQEVSDLQHRLLRVAHGPGARHQLGGAPEERARPGGDHHGVHFSLLDDAARIRLLAELLGHRERFTGQRSLVDQDVSASHEAKVGGNDHAEADVDDVARHQRRRVDGLIFTVAPCRRLQRETLLQGSKRVRRLHVLPEFETGVEYQQACDDEEIVPATEQGRYDGGGLDHVGDRAGEIVQDTLCQAHLLFGQRVGPVLDKSLASGLLREALVRRHLQSGQHLLDRNGFKIAAAGGWTAR